VIVCDLRQRAMNAISWQKVEIPGNLKFKLFKLKDKKNVNFLKLFLIQLK
jgi:hypothetical protein